MRNQIASEFRKLATTRSICAMLAGLIVIVGLGVVATTTDAEPGSLLAPLEHQVFLNVSLTIAPLFGLLLGLRSFTDEFRYGSIVPTLLANPVRRRVLGAKLVATAGGGVALSLAAVLISFTVGVPILVLGDRRHVVDRGAGHDRRPPRRRDRAVDLDRCWARPGGQAPGCGDRRDARLAPRG